jgi:hypothetical protein
LPAAAMWQSINQSIHSPQPAHSIIIIIIIIIIITTITNTT